MTLIALLWLVLGATASVFVAGRWNRAAAAWIAPVFLLAYAHAVPFWPALFGIWAAAGVAMMVSHWRIVPVPGLVYPFVVGAMTLPMVLPYLAARWLSPQLPDLAGTLVFPLAWVAIEYLGARANPFGTWGALAYTQARVPVLVQSAALTGIWGLPFVITWFAALVVWTVSQNLVWGAVRDGVMLYAAVLAAVLAYGAWRLRRTATATRTVTVAAVGWPEGIIGQDQILRVLQPGLAAAEAAAARDQFARVHEHFIARTREAARAGAKLVVWPEANAMVFRDELPVLQQRLQSLSRELAVYCLAGVAVVDPAAERIKFENRALLFGPDGTVAANYLKTTAVPGFEAQYGARGDGRLPVVETPYGRLTMAICYDLDFPWLLRQAGRARADLLLVPASDWREIGLLHHDAAVFRAVENGVTMVRATRWGISAMVDAGGRAIAMLDHNLRSSVLLVTEVPVGARPGLYARLGDAFAWVAAAGLVALVAWALARGSGLI